MNVDKAGCEAKPRSIDLVLTGLANFTDFGDTIGYNRDVRDVAWLTRAIDNGYIANDTIKFLRINSLDCRICERRNCLVLRVLPKKLAGILLARRKFEREGR